MSNVVKLKRGSGSDPVASDLVVGELAIRTDLGKIFTKKDNGNVAEISGGGGIDDGDKGDITVSNAGDTWTLDNGVVTSAKIADGTIQHSDIAAGTIGGSRLANSVIDDSKVASNAAIAGTKISPDFGSQNIDTTGDLKIDNINKSLQVGDISNDNYVDLRQISASSYKGFTFQHSNASVLANLQGSTNQYLVLGDNDNNNSGTIFGISIDQQGTVSTRLSLSGSGNLNVHNNITLGGLVDGVDIATRDTLFGGLTSSSGVLSNGVTATTQAQSDNSTKVSTTAYVRTAVSNLVNSAPSTLDTLNELAAALGDDANFSTTVTNSIATKLPLAGGQITGNITCSGSQTFDGRDLSVDGSKLDGIESGATADQTASEILTLIKTVDGAGSGLDADLLDGTSSADFYREVSSASATVGAGWMTVAENTSNRKHGEIFVSDSDSGDHSFIRIDWMRSYADSCFTVINCGGHQNRITGVRVLRDSDDTYGNKKLQVYVTANSTYRVAIKQIQNQSNWASHTVVTPVIQASISGYQVDGSSLENLDTYNFSAEQGIQVGSGGMKSLGNVDITGNITVSGTVDGADVASMNSKLSGIEAGATADQSNSEIKTAYEANSNTNAFTDALLSKLNGIAANATNVTNTNQLTNGAGFLTSVGTSNISNNAVDFTKIQDISHSTIIGRAVGSSGGNPAALTAAQVRAIINVENGATADQSASEILTLIKTVDGSGSGLDADNLDGRTWSTSAGNSTIVSRNGSGYIFGNYLNMTGTFSNSGNGSGMATFTGTNGSDTYGRSFTAAAARALLNVENGATADQSASEILTLIKTVDGSGSGLDADLLDGANASVSAGNNTIVKRHSSGYIFANYFNTTPNDVSSGVTKVCVETGNDGYIRHGTAAAIRAFINVADGANNITNNNQLTNGAGYITSANGGNAATLDGIDSSQFLRSDASDTFSEVLTLSKDTTDIINFSANSTNNNRGISFNGRTAVSADYNDGYLRLNNNQEFGNGVYTPLVMRADGGFSVDGTTVINGSAQLIASRLTGSLPAIDGSALTGLSAGASGGGSDEIFWCNGQTVTSSYTIPNGKNAMSAGPIAINSGVTVTVGSGETWTIV